MSSEASRLDSLSARKKYFFFSPWPVQEGSGVNNVMLGLAESMRADYEPVVVVTGWTAPSRDQLWMKLPNPTFGTRSLVGSIVHLGPNLLRLRKVLRGAAAINPHFFGTEVFPLAILRRAGLVSRLVLSAHGADVSSIRTGSRLGRRLYAWICRSADVVITCSHALAAEVKGLSPAANVVAIWNGTSTPPLETGARPIEEPYIVSVAAFVKKKGHDTLLRAFAEIAGRFPHHRLILIGGDGPEHPAIKGLIEQLGLADRVTLLAGVPHEAVWGWVSHADCFAHAAREEPFGLAVLEAALVKTPVVATAVGGVAEYLTDKVDGLLAPPDDPHSFAQLLAATLTDRAAAESRSETFFKKAGQFTWDAAWSGYRQAADLGNRNGDCSRSGGEVRNQVPPR